MGVGVQCVTVYTVEGLYLNSEQSLVSSNKVFVIDTKSDKFLLRIKSDSSRYRVASARNLNQLYKILRKFEDNKLENDDMFYHESRIIIINRFDILFGIGLK